MTSTPPPGRAPRPRLLLEGIVAVVLVVGGALFLISAIDVGVSDAEYRWDSLALGAGCVVAIVIGVLWGRNIEHRARRHTPVAHAYRRHAHGAHRLDKPDARPRPGIVSRRTYSPLHAAIAIVFFIAGTAGFAAGAVSEHAQGARSDETQHHGIRARGLVENVSVGKSCGRYSCDYTGKLLVAFTHPVAGVLQTTVHYPHRPPADELQQITVLVDPHQPSYAEIPGVKFKNAGTWIVMLVLSVVFLFFTLAYVEHLAHLSRFWRGHRRGAREATVHSRTKTVY